jgi:hypothetical protein
MLPHWYVSKPTRSLLSPQNAQALPGIFCGFSAFVLFIFVCVSGNLWGGISFWTRLNGRVVHFGVFGYTGIDKAVVGYNIQDTIGSKSVTLVLLLFLSFMMR